MSKTNRRQQWKIRISLARRPKLNHEITLNLNEVNKSEKKSWSNITWVKEYMAYLMDVTTLATVNRS